jgi:hypothetical protein
MFIVLTGVNCLIRSWDLSEVLWVLAGSPFKPLTDASLNLSINLAFPLTVTFPGLPPPPQERDPQ